MITPDEVIKAVELIKADQWDAAHEMAQAHSDPIANWLHAILHKIEGDVTNSHYWYSRTRGKQYNDFPLMDDELNAVLVANNANQYS